MKDGMGLIRRYRLENGVTLEAFAKRLGISHASLSRIERRRQSLTGDVMTALYRETGGAISPNDFLRERTDAR